MFPYILYRFKFSEGKNDLLNILEARGSTEMFPFIWLAQLLESVTGVILGCMYTMKSHRLSQVGVLGQKHLEYLFMRQHSESNLKKTKTYPLLCFISISISGC